MGWSSLASLPHSSVVNFRNSIKVKGILCFLLFPLSMFSKLVASSSHHQRPLLYIPSERESSWSWGKAMPFHSLWLLTQPGLSNLTLASAPFFHHLGRRILTTHTICLGLRESYSLNDRNASVRESLLWGTEAVAGCPWLDIAFGFLELSSLVAQRQSVWPRG